jgi:hypothetical protein
MKVLKSGGEIDPKKANKIKGGACSCHCDIGVSSTNVNVPGHVHDICLCNCIKDMFQDAYGDAQRCL